MYCGAGQISYGEIVKKKKKKNRNTYQQLCSLLKKNYITLCEFNLCNIIIVAMAGATH